MEMLGEASATGRGVKHVTDIVAAMAPPPSSPSNALPGSATVTKSEPAGKYVSLKDRAVALAPWAVGGALGALAWKDHRILGFVSAGALADAGVKLSKGGDKKELLCGLAVDASAVAGSLMWKRHPLLGFLGGALAGAAATYFVDGSPVRKAYEKYKAKK
jgi:hypothetical protein